jgi:type 1 glutamine amidotransferase
LPILLLSVLAAISGNAHPAAVTALFLGDKGHHNPAGLHKILEPAFATRDIRLDYTEMISDISKANLAGYDALVLYNNLDTLGAIVNSVILEYVNGGKGLLVVHCGIVMSGRDLRMDTLFGGRFVRHDTGTFRPSITVPGHAAMNGVATFSAWDETYVHRFAGERTVLMVRSVPGGNPEPWTWVRNQGKGRVYYTASGHDTRTWTQPAYQNQLAVGLRWAMAKEATGLGSDFHIAAPARSQWGFPAGFSEPDWHWLDGSGGAFDSRGRRLKAAPQGKSQR